MKLTDPHDHPEPHTMKWTQVEMDYINNRIETAVRQALADAALDKTADNARELGLDYMEGSAEQYEKALEQPAPAQEPVAFVDMREWPPIRWRDGMIRADVAPFDGQGLFFAPQPPAPAQPLTDEQIWEFWWSRPEIPEGEDDSMEAEFVAAVRRVLAAHGITKGGA
jgi:hypothetical protein